MYGYCVTVQPRAVNWNEEYSIMYIDNPVRYVVFVYLLYLLGTLQITLCIYQGVVTFIGSTEPFVTAIKSFEIQKFTLIVWLHSKGSLIAWYFNKSVLQMFNLFENCLLSYLIASSNHYLIAWFSINWHIDPLISFWSRSQMVLQVLWKWLP